MILHSEIYMYLGMPYIYFNLTKLTRKSILNLYNSLQRLLIEILIQFKFQIYHKNTLRKVKGHCSMN